MEIRPATRDDARPIAEIHVASWRAAYRRIVPAEWLAKLDVEQRTGQWHEWLGRSIVFVAAEPGAAAGPAVDHYGRVVGFVAANPATGEIAVLYLAPQHVRQGIGTKLLGAAHDALRAAGHADTHLWVFAANQAARAFYQQRGYAPNGTTDRRRDKRSCD